MGLTRVRNESLLLRETLDHFSRFCPDGIVVLDDASTDATGAVAARHPAVVNVLANETWQSNRLAEEWRLRQLLLDEGRRHSPDWFLYFDADERIDWDGELDPGTDALAFRLFDAYITEEDAELVGTGGRRWFGPEYRDIVMCFRNRENFSYWLPDQRVVAGPTCVRGAGFARHYGKAVSIAEFDATCDYYSENFPEPYRSKWLARKGSAVHSKSDFGRPLYRWPDVINHGVELHEASPPAEAPPPIVNAMRRSRANRYLCRDCGAPLAAQQNAIGEWEMGCSRSSSHEAY